MMAVVSFRDDYVHVMNSSRECWLGGWMNGLLGSCDQCNVASADRSVVDLGSRRREGRWADRWRQASQ